MEVEKSIKQLYENRLIRSDEEFELFENSIANLSCNVVLEDIPKLCLAFDDDTQERDVMFGLVHLIEQFEGEKSVECTIQGILKMSNRANDWALILIKRILNSDVDREHFKVVYGRLDGDSKSKVANLLSAVVGDNPNRKSSPILGI